MGLRTLQTVRLSARPWRQDDVDVLHRMWTDAGVRRFLWDDLIIPRERAAEVVQSHFETVDSQGIGYWLVIDRARDEPCGFCGFRFVDEGPEVEVMYGLLPEWWGRGYATEAVETALDCLWTDTNVARVFARTDPPNRQSVRVMERLGFTPVSVNETMITYVKDRPRLPVPELG